MIPAKNIEKFEKILNEKYNSGDWDDFVRKYDIATWPSTDKIPVYLKIKNKSKPVKFAIWISKNFIEKVLVLGIP